MISESPTEMIITSGVFHLANEKQNYKQMKTIIHSILTFKISQNETDESLQSAGS